MKRFLAVLLLLTLLLCGCDAEPSTPSTPTNPETGELARPDIKVVDFDAPALVIRVTINPDIELTLNQSNMILEAKPLNEDGSALLAELDLVGEPYSSGIVTILEEARKQEFLTNNTKVSISTREETEDAWTPASQILLADPVEDFQKDSGLRFICEVYPSGAVIDLNKLQLQDTEETDEYVREIYGDYSGLGRMAKYFYYDGSYAEEFYPDGYNIISIVYSANGSYTYLEIKDNIANSYTVYPDGSQYIHNYQLDGEGNKLWEQYTGSDGLIYEGYYFYEGDRLIRTVTVDPYGNEFETKYLEDGTVQDYMGNIEIQNPDGTTTIRHADGSTTLITYNDEGLAVTQNRIYPNGDFVNTTYGENGYISSIVSQTEGTCIVSEFGEYGQMLRDLVHRADGSTVEVIFYENGNPKTSKTNYPNGDYEYSVFYESGALKELISQIGGVYLEERFDESGNQIN